MSSTFSVVSFCIPGKKYPELDFSGPSVVAFSKVMSLVHNYDDRMMLEYHTLIHECADCVRLETMQDEAQKRTTVSLGNCRLLSFTFSLFQCGLPSQAFDHELPCED